MQLSSGVTTLTDPRPILRPTRQSLSKRSLDYLGFLYQGTLFNIISVPELIPCILFIL
jgi:hypothetical protein